MISRHRSLTILIIVLFAQLLVFGYQVRKNREIPFVRQWSILLVTPIEKAVRGISTGAWNIWQEYVDLRGARRENQRLIQQLDDAKLANQRLQSEAEQAKRLQVLLDLQQQTPSQTLAAAVIGSSGTDTSRLLLIDKGSQAGVLPDMAVIIPDGIVGKVLRVFPRASQVLLITDADSGVAALLESSRVHGIVRGQNKLLCKLGYVLNDDTVQIGERLFTSGEDQIYPKGLPVGVVVEARPGPSFQEILVQPLARLNRLEEVLIVTKKADAEVPPPAEGLPLASSPPPQPAPELSANSAAAKPVPATPGAGAFTAAPTTRPAAPATAPPANPAPSAP